MNLTLKGSGKTSCDNNESEFHVEAASTASGTTPQGPHLPSSFPTLGLCNSSTDAVSDIREMQERKSEIITNIFYPLVIIIVFAWGLGSIGASWAWLIFTIGLSWAFVKGTIEKVTDDYIRFESLRLHRRRALQSDETCEWLNLLLNRWWVFTSASIFSNLKNILDPRLQEAKPAFVETISLKHLNLGDRTPLLRSVRSWDAGIPYRPSCSLHTPSGLALAPTHAIAILCDLTLDSSSFSAILAARIGHKGMGVDLEVSVEHLVVEGRVLVTLFLDSEVPFPHIARLTFSFTERPKVSFKIKFLKSVQMMEVPVLKTWIHSLVTDALATAWVDPGQLEVNIHSSEAFVPEHRMGDALAQAVITVALKLQKGPTGSGFNTDEDKWVVIGLGDKAHVSTPFHFPLWHYSCSFLLLSSLSDANLVLKVKTKRLITTTLTQFDLPLSQYGLDACRITETVLHKKGTKVMGGNIPPLHVRIEYTPLPPVSLEVPIPRPQEDIGNGAGVLYIMVHGADNLISAEPSPSPYCLVFNSRRKIKTTHYVSDSLCPRWECSVELLVQDVASVCITFVVCSLPKNPKLQDGELLGIHTLNLSTVEFPVIQKQLPLNRNLSTPTTTGESSTLGSTLTASIVFRCVPSVAGCSNLVPENPNFKGMPLPMPLASGSPAGSPCLITSSSPNIGPSISPTRLSSSPQFSSIRRGSTGVLDIEEPQKKRGNTHWLHQAKSFLGSVHDHDGVRRQDVGDILASGLGLLELTIVRATDLVAKDLNGFSDPYCVVKVNGEVKYRTRIKKKTLDPYWNESIMTHLPKKNQFLVITLWDHDAFGMKDFLGSLTLKEEEVRTHSDSSSSIWCKLDGVKSGSLEVKFKLISEDFEFEKGSRCTSSVSNIEISKKTSSEDTEPTTSRTSSIDSGSSKCFGDKLEQANTPFLNGSPKDFTLSLPNRIHSRPMYTNKLSALKHTSTLLRASSNPTLGCYKSPSKDKEENYYIRSRIGPLCTPSRTRKSGAEIIASALALAQAKTGSPLDEHNEVKLVKDLSNKATFRNKPIQSTSLNGNFEPLRHPSIDTQFELESIHPIEKFRKVEDLVTRERHVSEDVKDVPKISLNDQSEDEYGLTDGSGDEFIDKTKPRSKRKGRRTLKAVKDKVCKGFTQPLRRFRSEANVHLRNVPSLTSVNISLEDIHDKKNVKAKQIFSCTSLGDGGGEGDASELLTSHKRIELGTNMLHARSQPNLSVKTLRSWASKVSNFSTEINPLYENESPNPKDLSYKTEKSSSKIQKRPSSETFYSNVRGVLRRIQGLHVAKPGRQLFVRIRISEERSCGRITIKTVGRSRLVPSSVCPIFECEWAAASEVSAKAHVVLEVRTSSRDLIASTSVKIVQLFQGFEKEEEADVENWVSLEGGAQILLRTQFGGECPPSTRRRSLFRSWSLHRIGKI